MSGGDYVWDRSGPADARVVELEKILASLRHEGTEPELVIGARAEMGVEVGAEMRAEKRDGADREWMPSTGMVPEVLPISRGGVRGARGLAAAAMVVLTLGAGWMARSSLRPTMMPWLGVESRGGSPRVGTNELDGRLRVGQWLSTDGKSTAEIKVADLGTVTVKPNSKIRVKNTGRDEHRLDMPYGSIHAFITAAPRVFVVDTPSATAIDMGCEYTLDMDENGSGILRVSLGHVQLEGPGGVKSDVPMWGGECKIRKGVGPGTPYFNDASEALIGALERFDFEGGGAAALQVVLDEAREKDSLSLWHLISRTRGGDREAVVGRLALLKPLPATIGREAVLRLEPGALEGWHEALRPY